MDKLISIIMGIYNCADTLDEAIQSILSQTYDNWEMIMCDDGSTDDTYSIAKKYVDLYPEKFILLKNEKNLGLNQTLNNCLSVSRGYYIARMDGDDISYPERFEEEIRAFNKNPDISIVSTDMEFFDENGVWGRTKKYYRPDNSHFMKSNPFCHAPCLVKKEAFDNVDGYTVSEKLLRVEDYHLWVKMYEAGYIGLNIQKPLYMMRDNREAQQRRKFRFRLNAAYSKAYAVKHLKLPVYNYIYCLTPIIKGILPSFIYKFLHRHKLSARD